MGKLFDAMERKKKEKVVRIDHFNSQRPNKTCLPDSELQFARTFCALHSCSDDLVVLSDSGSAEAENFKILRTHILFARAPDKPRTIMVTSALPGDGKTYVSANLGVSLALGIDEHVLMVDCDLRRPNLHNLLTYPNSFGLHEYLLGQRRLPDLIARTEIAKLSFLPAGHPPPNPSELLSSHRMEEFIQEVRNRYDDRFIIIDSPPSQIAAEVTTLAKYVDGIVFVIMASSTSRKLIQNSIYKLGKEKILGVVLNGYNQSHKSYKKYYNRYYKRK
jgi:exopolysaccharide/PEP-CTERM locus tyrosine autokinase